MNTTTLAVGTWSGYLDWLVHTYVREKGTLYSANKDGEEEQHLSPHACGVLEREIRDIRCGVN